MKTAQQKPDTTAILSGLKDFQRATVDYVFRRLYEDTDCVKRFLIADEVGLGKTLVARGVVAKAVDRLWADKNRRIDIVYVCANQDIARQNINRLNITGERNLAIATRMTLLPLYLHNLQQNRLNFVSFTPGTSFDLRSRGGIAYERALIYHLLREAWNFGDTAGPKNLLQVGVGRTGWRRQLIEFEQDQRDSDRQIDETLKKAFIDVLKQNPGIRERFDQLVTRFSHHRKRQNIDPENRSDQLVFVGDLRRLLAKSCLGALEPDIVILDEFQRFKYLLDGEDEMALLAQALFDYPDAKVLLLSATPYKMYTMYHERADDDHYADFMRTVRFLFNSGEETELFKGHLRRYREALFHLGSNGPSDLQQAKETIEAKLKQVMVRTERLSVTAARDAMIESRIDPGALTGQDLQAFATLDQVAQLLEARDTVEYWKSAPYLLNLMDHSGYQIKQKFLETLDGRPNEPKTEQLLALLTSGRDTLLSWETIRSYRPLDPGNAKLRSLLTQTVERGAWRLLWVPPSWPYYLPKAGPYADPVLRDFTKALVFSSWKVVPKVVATLSSYAAEQKMVTVFDKEADYQEERKKRRPLLRFALTRLAIGDSRYTGMSNLTLLYPCLTLATRLDPLETCVSLAQEAHLPGAEQVEQVIAGHIEELLLPVLKRYAGSAGRSDERWYWAALALLDRHYFRRPVGRWLEDETEECSWRTMVESRTGDDTDTNFAEHVDLFAKLFEKPEQLGRPPRDLVEIVTKLTLASPAVVALRALLRFCPKAEREKPASSTLAAAAKVALGFRSLFNIPDAMTLIRSLYVGEDTRYWQSVLNYCVGGNLQAVMDEYMHILREALGLISQPVDIVVDSLSKEVQTAVSIRTVNLNFDEIQIGREIKVELHSLRCRFALRFGDHKDDLDGETTRADQVRTAFNSPFHPFILVTTSIGQEGLDFHQYCHEIYHWNLPTNPVDLEQREGRIHRYKGHVIRRNIALAFPLSSLAGKVAALADPWEMLFSLAQIARDQSHNDLVPFWIFEPNNGAAGYKIQRHIPALPLSRDKQRLEGLRRTLVAYRMVFGQPRQEDLVHYLQARMDSDLDLDELLRYRIDLSPVAD